MLFKNICSIFIVVIICCMCLNAGGRIRTDTSLAHGFLRPKRTAYFATPAYQDSHLGLDSNQHRCFYRTLPYLLATLAKSQKNCCKSLKGERVGLEPTTTKFPLKNNCCVGLYLNHLFLLGALPAELSPAYCCLSKTNSSNR